MSENDAPPPTSAVLMSISKHIAVRCKKPNAAFIMCKKEDRNPEACLSQGNAVTSCTIDVYALSSLLDWEATHQSLCSHIFQCTSKHVVNITGDAVGHRLKEANDKAPAEFKAYTDCMDYYRCGLGVPWQDSIYVLCCRGSKL